MRNIEEVLGVEQGWFSVPYFVKTRRGYEMFPNCDRRNNFLDVVLTGMKVHSADFLRKVFKGEYGYIENLAENQKCNRANCGEVLPKEATKYSAPGMVEEGVVSGVPAYNF